MLIAKFRIGGVIGVVWWVVGGYINLFHFLLLLIGVLCGVGGAFCMWYCGICRFSITAFIVFNCCGVPIEWFL